MATTPFSTLHGRGGPRPQGEPRRGGSRSFLPGVLPTPAGSSHISLPPPPGLPPHTAKAAERYPGGLPSPGWPRAHHCLNSKRRGDEEGPHLPGSLGTSSKSLPTKSLGPRPDIAQLRVRPPWKAPGTRAPGAGGRGRGRPGGARPFGGPPAAAPHPQQPCVCSSEPPAVWQVQDTGTPTRDAGGAARRGRASIKTPVIRR